MDPESKKLLEETLELVKENNKMLHSMRRSMRMQRIMSYVYWVFIIGSAIGAFYLIQPYIEKVTSIYTGANGVFKGFNQSN